jgi:Domain of unknown function (DUF4404)
VATNGHDVAHRTAGDGPMVLLCAPRAAGDDHDLDFPPARIGARISFRQALPVMISETLSQIEARVRQTGSLTEDNKAELLTLLAALRTEIGDLARTKSDEAHRIAAIARNSTEAATHDQTNPELVKQSLDQLASAVSEFEESHPRLVEVVNRMATMLAGSGI